ncbi:MAG: allantoate amidohydrolase [Methylobacteriaceae bacterium]|nr:allantoate amidohydrolase [Methylobacteriaceae bacterium]
MARLDALAGFTDEPGRVTRLFLSPSHRRSVDWLLDWMREAGMAAFLDDVGNVRGRYEGATPGAPALLIGSHIDTVRDAGRYDGTLGVALGVAVVAELKRRGERLPFAIEVIGFGDEEGVRFPTTLAGSRAIAGGFDPTTLAACDPDGVSLDKALRDFGCDPARIGGLAMTRQAALAYVEAHIEQGPVLERNAAPLGVVTAINGATRFRGTLEGEAGHAGTVPMAIRRDALAGAAEIILGVEARAAREADLVATVGRIEAAPGAINVIPGAAHFTLDIRAPDDAQRRAAVADIEALCAATAKRRGLKLEMTRSHDAPAVVCDPRLVAALAESVAREGHAPLRLPSGAGHDAMAMAALCPSAMLFVRCKGGISHNPAESITAADAGAAFAALIDFVRHFDPERFIDEA